MDKCRSTFTNDLCVFIYDINTYTHIVYICINMLTQIGKFKTKTTVCQCLVPKIFNNMKLQINKIFIINFELDGNVF